MPLGSQSLACILSFLLQNYIRFRYIHYFCIYKVLFTLKVCLTETLSLDSPLQLTHYLGSDFQWRALLSPVLHVLHIFGTLSLIGCLYLKNSTL